MIFKQIKEIIYGTKTQTRRIQKPGERFLYDDGNSEHVILTPDGRVKWRNFQNYAVCPKRGQPCYVHEGKPLRIKIIDIHRERLQMISEEDARAEGVEDVEAYALLWDSINKRPGTRWADNPFVWVIEFAGIVNGGRY